MSGATTSRRQHCREGLSLAQGPGERRVAALCLAGSARVAGACGELAAATRLYAAADLGAATRLPPSGWDERSAHDLQVAALRCGLGEKAFAVAWAAGETMGLEQAVTEALSDLRG